MTEWAAVLASDPERKVKEKLLLVRM